MDEAEYSLEALAAAISGSTRGNDLPATQEQIGDLVVALAAQQDATVALYSALCRVAPGLPDVPEGRNFKAAMDTSLAKFRPLAVQLAAKSIRKPDADE